MDVFFGPFARQIEHYELAAVVAAADCWAQRDELVYGLCGSYANINWLVSDQAFV